MRRAALSLFVRFLRFLLFCCVLAPVWAQPSDLDARVQQFLDRSLPRLGRNLAVGDLGSVLAAPSRYDPNLYFHWTRDAALVVDALVQLLPYVENTPAEDALTRFLENHVRLVAKLQSLPSKYGLSDTRYNVAGTLDVSDWPRPQHVGPALRALALMRYRELQRGKLSAEIEPLSRIVVERDLDSVGRTCSARSFDLWETSYGFHYYTRVVQLGALEAGIRVFGGQAHPLWPASVKQLRRDLAAHWREADRVYAFSDGALFDQQGDPVTEPRVGLDIAFVLAANHARLRDGAFSPLDERLWSTAHSFEEYFRRTLPLNQRHVRGPALGRHLADAAAGRGSFIATAARAEHCFRIARALRDGPEGELIADRDRRATLEDVLGSPLERDVLFPLPDGTLAEAFARKGEAFLLTALEQIGGDGLVAFQFDGETGAPRSARDHSWSYAALLTAILEREAWHRSSANFSQLRLR